MTSMATPFFRRLFSRPEKPAVETTETRAGLGDAEAQFSLGVKFAREGATQDYPQAAEWYLKAADQSHSLAQFNLAIMYAAGQGVARDEAKSMGWMQKAADLGDAGAQYRVGMRHHRASLDGRRKRRSSPGYWRISGLNSRRRKAIGAPKPRRRSWR